MAIGTPTVHLTGDDLTTATSYSFTASSTPAAGLRLVAGVRTTRVGGSPEPLSVVAFGITLSKVVSVISSSTNHRFALYTASSTGASGTAVSVDVNDGGGSCTGCSVAIASHSGASGVLQYATNNLTGTSITATLAATTTGNGVAMFTLSLGSTTLAQEAGYTEAIDYVAGSGSSRMNYQWRADAADSTPTTTGGTSRELIAIGFELQAIRYAELTATLAAATVAAVAVAEARATLTATLANAAIVATAGPPVEPEELYTGAARWLATHDSAEVALVLWIDGLAVGYTTSHDVAGLQYAWGLATDGNFQMGLRGGLRVMGSVERTIELFAAQIQPSSLTFDVLDYDNLIMADMFGEARATIGATRLAETVDANDTVIPVEDVSATPNGTLYVGLETLVVEESSDDIDGLGTQAFTVTRGSGTLFPPAGGTTWARTHEVQPTTTDPPPVTDPPEVTSAPVNWLNREVGLYLCHKVGSTWSAGFPGTVVANDAELLWAGRIKHYSEDGQGWISLDCVELTEKLLTSVGTHMYEGALDEGQYFEQSQSQIRLIIRQVWPSPAASWQYDAELSISETEATHEDVATAINAAFTDAYVTHAGTYGPAGTGATLLLTDALTGSSRYTFSYLITGAVGADIYVITVGLGPIAWGMLGVPFDRLALQLDGSNFYYLWDLPRTEDTIWQGIADRLPSRLVFFGGATAQIDVVPSNGQLFVPQTRIPDGFPDGTTAGLGPGSNLDTHGFIRINEDRVFAVNQVSANRFIIVAEVLDDNSIKANYPNWDLLETLSMEDDGTPVQIRQVWIEPYTSVGHALLCLLCSTGTEGYNVPLYDTLPLGMGCAFPSSLLDIAGLLALTDVSYTLTVLGPTPAAKLIESALNVIGRHLVWRNSQLSVVDPIGGSGAWAPISLTEDNKAVAIGEGQALAPVVERTTCDRNPESIINRLTLRHSPTFKGEKWRRTLNVMATQSQSDFGQTKSVVIDGYGIDADAADLWATTVAATALSYFSRPVALCTRSFDFTLAPQLYPGAVVEVDDDGLIDPATGLRGVTGLSAWVLGVTFDWSTGVGAVKFVFQPRAA